jgi:type IV secretion system protein TrbL
MIAGLSVSRAKWVPLLGLVIFGSLLGSEPAMAQSVIDQVMTQYQTAAGSWVAPLRNYAIGLFWALAAIQFCWAMGSLALRGADIAEFLAELVTQIMFLGIFFFFVQQSDTIANDIITSFRQAATGASGTAGSNPTQILYDGINMAGKVTDMMSVTTPGIDVFYSIAAFMILIALAFIAAISVMVNIEAYLIVAALTLFTGFGGSKWTKEYAMRSLTYAIAIGGKLFMLNLVVGIGGQIIKQQTSTFTGTDYNSVMVLVGSCIVLLAICKSLPEMTQSLLTGASLGAGGALIGVGRTAANMAVGVATGGAGALVATGAASALASQQVAAAGGATSRVARMAALTGRTASNLGSAAMSDIGGRLAGTRTNRGSMPFRMAADMRNQSDSTSPPPVAPRGAPNAAPPSPPSSPAASGSAGENIIRPS